jgi:hypothetical protein
MSQGTRKWPIEFWMRSARRDLPGLIALTDPEVEWR